MTKGDKKSFWLKFRQKLETLSERGVIDFISTPGMGIRWSL